MQIWSQWGRRELSCIASAPHSAALHPAIPLPTKDTRGQGICCSLLAPLQFEWQCSLFTCLQGDNHSMKGHQRRGKCAGPSLKHCMHMPISASWLWWAVSSCFPEDFFLDHLELKPKYCTLQPLSYECAMKERLGGWWREKMKIFLTACSLPILPSEVCWQTKKIA